MKRAGLALAVLALAAMWSLDALAIARQPPAKERCPVTPEDFRP